MKNNREIAFITTGIGLIALWAWYAKDRMNHPDQKEGLQNSDEAQEDSFSNGFIGLSLLDNEPSKPKKIRSGKRKKSFKGLAKVDTRFGSSNFYKRLQSVYDITQLTLTNTSEIEREVRLWAGNKKPPLSPTLPGDVSDHVFRTININSSLGTSVYPQGIVVNPFNGYTYIANQLSNNISVLDNEGTIVTLIPISAIGSSSSLPIPAYGSGPVDLAVNSQTNSPNFGEVYVANVLGDTVTVIDTLLEVKSTISVGKRPIGIAFNPFNAYLYIANIADDTVSVIDTATETLLETIPVGKAPKNITVVPENGFVYVVNSNDDSISVIDTDNQVTTTIENVGNAITTATYNPMNASFYVVSSADNRVIPIDLETNIARAAIEVGADPYRIVYNPTNELLYVGNRGDNSYSLIDRSDTVIDTLLLGEVGTGLAVSPDNDNIYSSNSTNGSINLISYSRESNKVLINDEYYGKREDFKFNPAIVEHVKFVLSGTERFKVLKLEEDTVTGTTKVKPISFASYNSPQNFGNVAEVFEMKGAIIDGKNGWVFKIAGKQTITILTYYKQFETEKILEHAIHHQKTREI